MRMSYIIFIVINIVVMSMPYWTARPFNTKIRAGEIGNRRLEDSLRRWRKTDQSFSHVVCTKQTKGLKVNIKMGATHEISTDTSALNFITVRIQNDTLYIQADDEKYKKWSLEREQRNASENINYSEVPVDVVSVISTDEEGNIEIGYEFNVTMAQLKSITTQNVAVSLAMFPGEVVQNALTIHADNADVEINYTEEIIDSTGASQNLSHQQDYPFVVKKQNGSSVSWYNFMPTQLTLELNNDYFNFEGYIEEVEYRPTVILDKNSDIGINLSMLNKIKLHRK